MTIIGVNRISMEYFTENEMLAHASVTEAREYAALALASIRDAVHVIKLELVTLRAAKALRRAVLLAQAVRARPPKRLGGVMPKTSTDGSDAQRLDRELRELKEGLAKLGRKLAACQWYTSPSYEPTPSDAAKEAVEEAKAAIGRDLLECLGITEYNCAEPYCAQVAEEDSKFCRMHQYRARTR